LLVTRYSPPESCIPNAAGAGNKLALQCESIWMEKKCR